MSPRREARNGGYLRAGVVAMCVLGACSGTISDGERPATPVEPIRPADGRGPPSQKPPADPQPRDEAPAPTVTATAPVMRRLTRSEYDQTVKDLLGDDTRPGATLPADEVLLGFDNNAEALTFSPARAEALLLTAEAITTRAMARLGTLVPCAKAADNACAQTFIADFGKRAFRRPLSAAETTRFQALFQTGQTLGGWTNGVSLVMRAMLVSAPFHYLIENGSTVNGERALRLDSWSMAARLSYTFWGTMPDAALFAAAEQNALFSGPQIAAQVARLLEDPRARHTTRRFHAQWLQMAELASLEKSTKAFPQFAPWVPAAYGSELEAFLEDVTWTPGPAGLMSALYTANHSFVNAKLAGLYGLNGGPTGNTFERVTLDPAKRAGLLTSAPMMANIAHPNQTAPTLRGKFVREQLLCQITPPPPPGLNNAVPDPDPSASTRERFVQHAESPSCAGCHRLMDPIGFALESYDGLGLWRDKENAKPIDVRGEAPGTDLGGPFVGGLELGRRLAESTMARVCLATQWFRFALGRIEQTTDAPTIQAMADALARPGATLPGLLQVLAQSESFRTRLLVSAGGMP